jgi:hypothetical protein
VVCWGELLPPPQPGDACRLVGFVTVIMRFKVADRNKLLRPKTEWHVHVLCSACDVLSCFLKHEGAVAQLGRGFSCMTTAFQTGCQLCYAKRTRWL